MLDTVTAVPLPERGIKLPHPVPHVQRYHYIQPRAGKAEPDRLFNHLSHFLGIVMVRRLPVLHRYTFCSP